MSPINSCVIKDYLLTLQHQIRQSLQVFETKPFLVDEWQRQQGGGGLSCVLQQGNVFESAGVNFSHVYGESMPGSATAHRPELAGRSFEAMGVSLVIHPQNPFVPTSHMNVRFFRADKKGAEPVWWFGGGFDLTPYYPKEEEVIYWHKVAKAACHPFGEKVYATYKAWADKYFFLPHRNETRGIGGLFFDDLNSDSWGWSFDRCFEFMRSVGNHFWQAYGPLVENNYQAEFTDAQRQFQCYRRGRYVEFNLLYDRGTLFGLQSAGRTESILMSLPPCVHYAYRWEAQPGTPEAMLYERYLKPQQWIS